MARQTASALHGGRGLLSRWGEQLAIFSRRKPLGAVGAGSLVVLVVLAVFASLIATHDPLAIDVPARLQGPSWSHLFGTDQFGRDVFSRIVYGTRVSIIVGLGGAAITVAFATVVGVVSGYFRGSTDMLIQRVVDAFMSLPTMIVLLMAVFLLGKSLINVVVVLGVIGAPPASRVIRGSTISVMANQYIESARAVGCSDARIIIMHVLPNIAAPVLVMASIAVGGNILAEAAPELPRTRSRAA